MRIGIFVGLMVWLIGMAPDVRAQSLAAQYANTAPAPQVSTDRSGFTFGFSIGRGSIDIECDDCSSASSVSEALSVSAHAGWMVSPRLAVLAEYWGIRFNDRGTEWFDDSQQHLIAQTLVTVGGQLWLGDYFFLRGGVGYGRHQSNSRFTQGRRRLPNLPAGGRSAEQIDGNGGDDTDRMFSPAATVGIGFEWARTKTFGADVMFRVGGTRHADRGFEIYNTGVTFGLNWY